MRPMIDAAWDWAKSRNLWRVNPIHKEDEIKVIVDDFFKYSEEEGIETQQIGTMEMQDYSSSTVNCNMWSNCIPTHFMSKRSQLPGFPTYAYARILTVHFLTMT